MCVLNLQVNVKVNVKLYLYLLYLYTYTSMIDFPQGICAFRWNTEKRKESGSQR